MPGLVRQLHLHQHVAGEELAFGVDLDALADLDDLDRAVTYAINGIFGVMGEVCSAGSRLLVDKPILQAFTEKFIEKYRKATAKAVKAATKAPAAKAAKMMVWRPDNNKMFETFSYLPPLSNDQIARQVDYIVNNGWTPCLEVAEPDVAYVANTNVVRLAGTAACYYDNRYWTMWKLPMFGCTDPTQVLKEIENASKAFPDSYVRMCAFDASKQVQVASMLVHRPASAKDYRLPADRQV